MPERLLAAVRAYFDAAGPLIGRPWPIVYREDEQARVAALRAFGVARVHGHAVPAQAGHGPLAQRLGGGLRRPHPGLPAHRDVLRRAVAPPPTCAARLTRAPASSSATSRWATSTRTTRCSTRRGALLAEAGVPVVTHCGSGPGARPVHRARPGRRGCSPATRGSAWWSRTWACPSTRSSSRLAERHDSVLLDTTMAFTAVHRATRRGARSPRPSCPGCATSATACCSAPTSRTSRTPTRTPLSRWSGPGLGTAWLRAVCHDNAARLFAR